MFLLVLRWLYLSLTLFLHDPIRILFGLVWLRDVLRNKVAFVEVPVLLEILDLRIRKGVFRLRSLLFDILILNLLFLDRLLLVILIWAQRDKGLVTLSWLLTSTIKNLWWLLLFGILDVGLSGRLLRTLFLVNDLLLLVLLILLLLVLWEMLPLFGKRTFRCLLRRWLIRIGLMNVFDEGLRVFLKL